MNQFKTINYKNTKDASIIDKLRSYFKGGFYYIYTYGCQLNENDSEKIAGVFQELGMEETDSPELASVITMNTCTIRENANDKLYGNLGIIKSIKSDNPDILVILCGCMMKEKHNAEKIKSSYRFVDIVFGPSDIYGLADMLYRRINEGRPIYQVGEDDHVTEELPVAHKKRFRALSTIIYGCNNFCSYCVVPYVRGRERSRSPENIIKEIERLGREGYKEVMLLGQNVNSYGKNIAVSDDGVEGVSIERTGTANNAVNDAVDFAVLLDKISGINSISRIRFMTSHPKDTSKKLLDIMAGGGNIMPHLHLPVQSGSNNILKKMNRKYTKEEYMKIVEYARKVIPDISITTDFIVGFPGETEEDFQDTLDLMKTVKFDSAFTFMFSPRVNTPASEMENTVPPDIIKERFQRLVNLQNMHSLEKMETQIGKIKEILVEGVSQKNQYAFTGRTPENFLVNFTVPGYEPPDISGSECKCKCECECECDINRNISNNGNYNNNNNNNNSNDNINFNSSSSNSNDKGINHIKSNDVRIDESGSKFKKSLTDFINNSEGYLVEVKITRAATFYLEGELVGIIRE